MAFRGAVDRRLLHALGAMTELPAAEAWRRLSPIAARLGVRRPSYPTVRRALLEQRWLERLRLARLERRQDLLADLLADLLSGRVPHEWLHMAIVGKPLYPAAHSRVSRPPPGRRDSGAR